VAAPAWSPGAGTSTCGPAARGASAATLTDSRSGTCAASPAGAGRARHDQPVRWLKPWSWQLTAQHRYLVAQKHQLDVLGCLTTTTHHDQRQQTADDRIDQREHHEIIVADPASTTAIGVFERHRTGPDLRSLATRHNICAGRRTGSTELSRGGVGLRKSRKVTAVSNRRTGTPTGCRTRTPIPYFPGWASPFPQLGQPTRCASMESKRAMITIMSPRVMACSLSLRLSTSCPLGSS
jgi:hypothetical protein